MSTTDLGFQKAAQAGWVNLHAQSATDQAQAGKPDQYWNFFVLAIGAYTLPAEKQRNN